MDLKFLGRGSAYNYKEGNTSAYFIDNNELFLIDCGEDVFQKLLKKRLLENKNIIHVLITHTHSDHVGSLGSLILYSYYVLKQKVNIIISENKNQKIEIESVLKCFGIEESIYNFRFTKDYENKYNLFTNINYIKTEHTPLLNCFSIIFDTDEGIIFYSGDSSEVSLLQVLLKGNKKIAKMYIDVCNDKNNIVHMYLEEINKIIPENIKDKIYGMHFNNVMCIEETLNYNFNIVEINE